MHIPLRADVSVYWMNGVVARTKISMHPRAVARSLLTIIRLFFCARRQYDLHYGRSC